MNGTSAVPSADQQQADEQHAAGADSGRRRCRRPAASAPTRAGRTPNARLMLARPRPVVVLMALRNRPIDWRAPIVTAKMPPAASRTRPNGDRRAARRRGVRVHSVIGGLLSVSVERGQAFVDQRVQRGDARGAEPLVERELGALPLALRFGALGAAARRWRRRRRRAAVGARRRPRPSRCATSGCRLRVSVDASISIAAARSPGRIGPSRSTCESSEYCVVFRPGGADDAVVVLADAARQLAQLEVGAAARRAAAARWQGGVRMA